MHHPEGILATKENQQESTKNAMMLIINWIEVDERTRPFLPNNMEKFIEHRLSGDYWIKEMGGGRIS